MNGRLLLHAGLPKTGTKALQAWLFEHQQELAATGISYAPQLVDPAKKHAFLVRELRTGPLDRTRIALADAAPTVVLSNEGLSNHVDDFRPELLAEFRALSQARSITVLAVTRERDTWLRSYYNQCVLNPPNGASELWGTSLRFDEYVHQPRVLRLLDHRALLDTMTRAYGAARTIWLRYESNWFEAILEELGVPSLGSLPPRRTNESLPDWAIEFVRQLNERATPEPERMAWQTRLERFNTAVARATSSPDGPLVPVDFAVIASVRRSPAFATGDWREALDAFEASLAGEVVPA